MKEVVTPEEMEEAVFTDDKQTREENIRVVTEKLEEAFADNEEWLAILPDAKSGLLPLICAIAQEP